MQTFSLSNGISIPAIGYGTYRVTDHNAEALIQTVLQCGYRHIDTARMYGNEAEVGNAIRHAGISRSISS